MDKEEVTRGDYYPEPNSNQKDRAWEPVIFESSDVEKVLSYHIIKIYSIIEAMGMDEIL